jgi:hypothetical protein
MADLGAADVAVLNVLGKTRDFALADKRNAFTLVARE